jgi:pheromone shutdown protein TraB
VDIDKVFLKKKECSAGFICADIVVIIGLKHKRGIEQILHFRSINKLWIVLPKARSCHAG